ncbi:VWA domain-containing protein [Rhodococcus rhodnii]|nr:VWA domain-containing protein [Rhodococcus rhodnii]TXG92796.1 VWA domain-containing protein [Rhodococcus rhodnii]
MRRRGITVGPAETVDAARVMSVLDLLDREVLREGLACALLRRSTHRPTFDALFDLWFPRAVGAGTSDGEDGARDVPRRPDGSVDLDALRETIAQLLTEDSDEAGRALDQLTAAIVGELGRYDSPKGPSFSAYQALRELDPASLLDKILGGLLGNAPGEGSDPAGRSTARYADEVAARGAAQRLADFRNRIEDETKRRTAERLGRERVANYGVPALAEEVDFLRASDRELTELRRTVAPLARLLASRLAARRARSRSGAIDLRRTLRRSMSTGGVPIDLVQRKPRRARPELVVLCDVSGSVAGFSHFTLLLVDALREQFSRVRIFAFVDRTDEVTRFFDSNSDLGAAMSRIVSEADIVGYDGHSDYGSAFATFADRFADRFAPAITSRTSLLVLGDARTNYRDPELGTLAHLASVAKHAYWLNPEPRGQWGLGDSAADVYGEVVPMHECRSAKQLADVVAGLLPV